jgi:beta-phosphoglucomutase-like phosphatase (HAD superfamily)
MGLPQGIASGALHSEIKIFLEHYGLTEYVPPHRTVAYGDFTHPKPHPEPFDMAFATLGLPDTPEMRSRVLAFEDNRKGILSARAAGLMVAALTTREPAEVFLEGPARADIVAADFEEYAKKLL